MGERVNGLLKVFTRCLRDDLRCENMEFGDVLIFKQAVLSESMD